jgi:uncharacterized membrane protein YagU involved in acid resistance
MYFQRYSIKVNKPLVTLLYSLLFVVGSITTFGMVMAGQLYIYHIVVSLIFSLIFLMVCLAFDAEILNKCE